MALFDLPFLGQIATASRYPTEFYTAKPVASLSHHCGHKQVLARIVEVYTEYCGICEHGAIKHALKSHCKYRGLACIDEQHLT